MTDTNSYGNPVTATLSGIADLFRKKERIGTLADNERLDGKTCLITGANSGLGKAAAIELAKRGARVIMACRSGIPAAGEDVRQASGSERVEMLHVDLSDLSSVRGCVEYLDQHGITLDRVILNAGIVPNKDVATAQGFELMFGVHFVANMALVQGLLETGLVANSAFAAQGKAARDERPRIVFVASEAHRSGTPIDLESFGDYVEYNAMASMAQYGHSKRALLSYVAELTERLHGQVDVHALCPGPVDSNIARGAPGWVKPVLGFVMGKLFRSPAEASEPVLFLACAHAIEGETGIYLHLMTRKPIHEQATDPAVRRAVWAKGQEFIRRD